MTVPANLRYTIDHEWLDLHGDVATVGITAFAADALGDVVFVELPEVGTRLAAGQVCGEIESTKSVSELYAPIAGEVTEINEHLANHAGLVNTDPYGDGWLFRARVTGTAELLDADAYTALTEGR